MAILVLPFTGKGYSHWTLSSLVGTGVHPGRLTRLPYCGCYLYESKPDLYVSEPSKVSKLTM